MYIHISWLLSSQLLRIHTVFRFCKNMVITGILQVDWIKFGEECSTKNIQQVQGMTILGFAGEAHLIAKCHNFK